MDFGYRETVFRPRAGRALAAVVMGLCAFGLVALVLNGDPELVLRSTPALGLVGFGAYALFWRPSVRIGPADLEIVNPFRTIRITWPAVRDVETRWNLTLLTTAGRFSAWAAPREGGLGSGRTRRSFTVYAAGTAPEGGHGSRAPGAVAGMVARRQWEAYRDRGLLGAVEGEGVVVHPHVLTVVVTSVLALAVVGAASLP